MTHWPTLSKPSNLDLPLAELEYRVLTDENYDEAVRAVSAKYGLSSESLTKAYQAFCEAYTG